MKNLLLLLLAIAAGTTGAMADSGIFGGYITLNLNGAGTAFYKLENPADNSTPPFSGVNFGIFNPALGQSFLLTGGEADTYKNSGSNVSASYLNYRIYPTGSPSGSFSSLNLPYNTELGGGDQKWQTLAATINLLAGLPNGSYTLEVFLNSDTRDGAKYLNGNSGSNYLATFSVVPEPSSFALIAGPAILGAWFFVRRRRA